MNMIVPWLLKNMLDKPVLWNSSRAVLDLLFGMYSRRFCVLREWGVLSPPPTILELGCGTGRYAQLPHRSYLGIDVHNSYVRYGWKRNSRDSVAFRNMDATELSLPGASFDIVLMVDFLHHLPDDACRQVLDRAGQLAKNYIISFEPLQQQTNRLGRWLIDHDRGKYMRSLQAYHQLFRQTDIAILDSRLLYLGPTLTCATLCQGMGA